MSTQEVCRLCLSEENLMCVFDKRLEKTDHMKEVILITTGVEIHSKDVVSQKICTKCGRDAIKMFQFRQQSLKNDRYLKAQCRELLKHIDLKIPNTNVTIKTERKEKEEIKQEPLRKPAYKVHPTMIALSRKYPQLQFPSLCLLSNIDPCISMEMDTVENYFKNRNLNMQKYVQSSLRASNEVIPKKTWTVTKSLVKSKENSANNRITDHGAQRTPTAILKTVGNAEVVDKISPINMKLHQSGYAIVRSLADILDHDESKNVCKSTSSCKTSTTCDRESQSVIIESRKRRYSDNDFSSEPITKKVFSLNPSSMMPVQPIVENISPPVFKCHTCSSVEFSAEDLLKKHQLEHSRCNFCKVQFKSVGIKQQHIGDCCIVKEVLNNMPDVEVERIELNMNVRLHYQDAFTNFPPPGSEKISSIPKSSETAAEFIEIISDDENTSTSVSTANSVSTKPVPSNNSARTPSTVPKTLYPPLSLMIRPNVRMKNDNVLDSLKTQTPDIETVKELLTKSRKLQSATEATQTVLPSTESIRMKKGILSAELINLKQALHSYQIPVKIQKGPVNVIYNYQQLAPRPKILQFWNDLTPIDFKAKNNPVISDLVIIDITGNHSDRNASSININKSCDSFNKDESALQNIEIVLPANSKGFPSSDSSRRNSPTVSAQAEFLISTSEYTAMQAESHTSPLLNSPHSNSNSLEIFPLQATSPIGDIPMRQYSPNYFVPNPPAPHINNPPLPIYPVQATSSMPNAPSGRNSSGVEQTASQNNAYTGFESRRKSPDQNQSDENATWNSLNIQSEALDCTTKTRQDLTNKAIKYVFNKSMESIGTGTPNVRSPNGTKYRNNNQQPRPRASKASKPKGNSQRAQSKRHVPATTKSRTNVESSYVSKTPLLKNTLSDNNYFMSRPPPPYPNGSIYINQTASPPYANGSISVNQATSPPYPNGSFSLNQTTPPPYSNGSISVNQTTQSYISSRADTSNIPHAAETPRTNGFSNAFHQYVSQLQEFRPFPTVANSTGTYHPNVLLNDEAHHSTTGNFTATHPPRDSLEIRSVPRVPEAFGYNGIESSAFPHYSKASEIANPSVVSTVSQNCNFSNRQIPNVTYTYSSTPAVCDTLTDSVYLSDKSKHYASGMIRVRNVSELT